MNEEILVVEIDDHCYGLRVENVCEVLRAVALSPLPSADDLAEGVLNLRGRSVPVINARRRFGFPDRAAIPSDYLIVMQTGQRLSAMHVDRAIGLVRIDTASIEQVDPNITSQPAVIGIVKLAARVVFLLDTEKLGTEAAFNRLDKIHLTGGSQETAT